MVLCLRTESAEHIGSFVEETGRKRDRKADGRSFLRRPGEKIRVPGKSKEMREEREREKVVEAGTEGRQAGTGRAGERSGRQLT